MSQYKLMLCNANIANGVFTQYVQGGLSAGIVIPLM